VIEQQGETRRRREHVVGGLAHVDVIVRMHVLVGAFRRAEQFRGAIGEHLVGVHVVRRTGARLVDVNTELIAEFAAEDFVRRLDDRIGDA
jgi:hypothetical protein